MTPRFRKQSVLTNVSMALSAYAIPARAIPLRPIPRLLYNADMRHEDATTKPASAA